MGYTHEQGQKILTSDLTCGNCSTALLRHWPEDDLICDPTSCCNHSTSRAELELASRIKLTSFFHTPREDHVTGTRNADDCKPVTSNDTCLQCNAETFRMTTL